jgi:hypothetical protein
MPALKSRFRTVIILGCGQVVRDRIRLALAALRWLGVRRIVYLDVFDNAPFDLGEGEVYIPVLTRSRIPVESLAAIDALGPGTLAIVCTPTEWHLHYAEQLQPLVGRVACEKPLTHDYRAAGVLLVTQPNLQPISHFLYKKAMREWLARCRTEGLGWLGQCTGIRIDLIESRGIGQRAIDPVLHDLGWHFWEMLLAPFRAAGMSQEVELMSTATGAYDPGPGEPRPTGATAARLVGQVRAGGFRVPFDARLGKGLGADSKALVYLQEGSSRRIDLSESGSRSHQRLLQELLTADQPDLGLDLADAVEVVRLCAISQEQARNEGSYTFGQMPAFLSDDALMGLYW